jgi:hypothetical protein
MRSGAMMLGHGNPRLRVIFYPFFIIQNGYGIKENSKMRAGKGNLLMLKFLDRRV